MIYLAYDHAGFERMKVVTNWLTENKYEWKSLGPSVYDPTDSYVDFVTKANYEVKKAGNFGIYMCGTGVGVSIAANRTRGIRGVLCNQIKTAYFSRVHNNANVICLSAGYKGFPKMSDEKLLECVNVFLNTEFEGGRHLARVKALDEIAE